MQSGGTSLSRKQRQRQQKGSSQAKDKKSGKSEGGDSGSSRLIASCTSGHDDDDNDDGGGGRWPDTGDNASTGQSNPTDLANVRTEKFSKGSERRNIALDDPRRTRQSAGPSYAASSPSQEPAKSRLEMNGPGTGGPDAASAYPAEGPTGTASRSPPQSVGHEVIAVGEGKEKIRSEGACEGALI
jgi:hypothetical protein